MKLSKLQLSFGAFLFLTLNISAQIAEEAWVRRYSGPGDATEIGIKVATDAAGNVIMAGVTDERITSEDMLVIKYSSAGVPMWTNRYNGPANGNDDVRALAVDGNGNVFVTGHSIESNTSSNDFLTIAYSSAGMPLWTNRYNGPGNNSDVANAMAVDSNGNVFVTGYSWASGSSNDFVTIAYSGAGVPLWTNRYNGSGNKADVANAIAVDNIGNVIVTGFSWGTSDDFATIKYSGAGVPLWTNRFNGPGGNSDVAKAVGVDTNGNVFVTGSSLGIGSTNDFATVAYSSAGVAMWTNRYNGPGNNEDIPYTLAVDNSGNVLVAGRSSATSDNLATIKYSGTGVPLLTNRYVYHGGPNAIVLDVSGNVFVTGNSWTSGGASFYNYLTSAFSNSGLQLWTNSFNGTENGYDIAYSVALDNSGNVFVTGQTHNGSTDSTTIKYSGAGVAMWTNTYNGWGNSRDYAKAVAADSVGNVFVTGQSRGMSNDNFLTISYSSAGLPLWTKRYSGSGTYDTAVAVAVNGSGNVIVTGASYVSNSDYVTIMYSGTGFPLWTNRYNGPGNGFDAAYAVVTDSNDNAIVTGYSWENNGDYTTIKYSGSGMPLWTNRYNGPGNASDYAVAAAVDNGGNIFVTGYSKGTSGTNDYATIAYSGAGVPLWTNRYNGPGDDNDQATAVVVDGSGNITVTGYSKSTSSGDDYATIAYSGVGLPLWTNRYNGPANGSDQANAITVNSSGSVFVTGSSSGSGSTDDYATIAYSGAGVPLWTNRYNGPGNGIDRAAAVVTDGTSIVVTGYSTGSGSSDDFATIAYSTAGLSVWTNRYNGPANGPDQPLSKQSLALGPDSSVFVTGASDGDFTSGTNQDYVTIKYAVSPPILTQLTYFTNLHMTPSGFQFVVQSGPGTNSFVILASTNLTDWQPILTNPATVAPVMLVDPDATNMWLRFYRGAYSP